MSKTILLKACTYKVRNAKGRVYNLRTLENVRIRPAKLKKGCFWGFVANEDEKEEKQKKEKEDGEKKAGAAAKICYEKAEGGGGRRSRSDQAHALGSTVHDARKGG